MSLNEKIPSGWSYATVGDILKVRSGYAFKRTEYQEHGTPLIRQSDIREAFVDISQVKRVSSSFLEQLPGFIVKKGDLLVGMSGSLGKIAKYQSDEPSLQNQRTGLLQIESCIHPDFATYVLKFVEPQIVSEGKGIAVQNVSGQEIEACKFPMPPLGEQTRIVEKLEELLSGLDDGVAELKSAQKKLVQYRQSLLKAAVEGTLTAEWRKTNQPKETGGQLLERILKERRSRWEAKQLAKFQEQSKTPLKGWQDKYSEPVKPDTTDLPELPEGWVWASMDMLTEIQGGIQKQPSRAPVANKFPFLRVANVARGQLKLEEIHEIELFEGEIARFALQKGDLLIVEGNGSLAEIGRCALWDGSIENAVHQNHLIRARPVLMQPEFIEAWLNSLHGIEKLTKLAATTSGLYTLSVGKISRIPVPVPPLEEQSNTVIIMKAALEEQMRQQVAIAHSLKQSTVQRKNILKAAFSGQLVPQDPNDEPASVLLEGIRAGRTEIHKAVKPRIRRN